MLMRSTVLSARHMIYYICHCRKVQ